MGNQLKLFDIAEIDNQSTVDVAVEGTDNNIHSWRIYKTNDSEIFRFVRNLQDGFLYTIYAKKVISNMNIKYIKI